MSPHFPDTTAYHEGQPTELTGTEQRRGPSLPLLCALMVLALFALLLAISEALAGDLPAAMQRPGVRGKSAESSGQGGRPLHQDPATLVAPAEQLLLQEGAALGEVRVQVNPPDTRLELPQCAQLDAFLPPGARAQGHTTVAVRCIAPTRWTVYLQAQVQVIGAYLAAARPLAAGQILAANDLVSRSGDLAELPAGVVSDADSVIGRPLGSPLAPGQALRRDNIKAVPVVNAGQTVHLVVTGRGFQVSGEGVAVGNAGEGQTVQVRTPKGNLVSGVARPGPVVEVRL